MKLITFILLLSCIKTVKNLEIKNKVDEEYWLYIKEDKDKQLEKFLNKEENKKLDLNVLKNEEGEASLTLAVKCKSLSVINFLLNSNRVDIEQENQKRQTALIIAILDIEASLERDKIIDILLSKGANVNKSYGLKGNSALMLSINREDINIINKILKIEMLDVSATNLSKETALILTLKLDINEDRRVEIFKALLNNKNMANILNFRDNLGKSALIHSVSVKRPEILFLLTLKNNLDINIQDYKGKSALMYAIEQRNFIAINFLIKDDRLNLDIKDINNKSSINYLLENFDNEIFELLNAKSNMSPENKIYVNFINKILEKIENSKFNDADEFFEANECYYKNENVFKNIINFCFNYSFKDKNANFLEGLLAFFNYMSTNNEKFYKEFYGQYIHFSSKAIFKAFENRELYWLNCFFEKIRSFKNSEEIISELLNKRDENGDTILIYATKNSCIKVLNSISHILSQVDNLDNLEYFSIENFQGKTALDYDENNILKNFYERCLQCFDLLNSDEELEYHLYKKDFFNYKKKLKLLYLSKEKFFDRNKLIFENLIILMSQNKENIAMELINEKEFDINFNYRDKRGASLIHYFARYGKLKLISEVLKKDIKQSSSKDYEGNNFLVYLINSEFLDEKFKLKILQNLFEIEDMALNINSKNNVGMTPLLFVCFNGYKEIVELLLYLENLDLNIKYNNKNLIEVMLCFLINENNDYIDYVSIYNFKMDYYLNIIALILKKDPSLFKGEYLLSYILKSSGYVSTYILNIIKKIDFNFNDFISEIEKADQGIDFGELYSSIIQGNLDSLKKIIDLRKVEFFNVYFEDGKTFLHHLVKFPPLLRKSLKIQGVNLNISKEDGYTPLIESILNNNLFSLKLLTENKDVDINILFENNTPLMLAIARGNLKACEILLKRDDVKLFLVNKKLKTALELAIDFERFEIAVAILEKGKERLIINPGFLKELTKDQLKLFEKAIQKNHISIYYKAFIEAAKKGKVEIIEKSLDLNIINSDSEEEYLNDIFDVFIKNNDINSFERLLEKRKKFIQEEIVGDFIIHKVVKENRIEFLKLLLRKGADLYKLDIYQGNLIHTLCNSNYDNMEIAKFLIEKGIDIDAEDNFQNTPLILACSRGNTKLVKLLIEQNININKQNKDGDNPLIEACKIGNLDIVKMLIDNKNIDIEIFNNKNMNALMIAELCLEEFLDDFLGESSSYSSDSSYSNFSEELEEADGDSKNDFILQRNFEKIISLLKNYKK